MLLQSAKRQSAIQIRHALGRPATAAVVSRRMLLSQLGADAANECAGHRTAVHMTLAFRALLEISARPRVFSLPKAADPPVCHHYISCAWHDATGWSDMPLGTQTFEIFGGKVQVARGTFSADGHSETLKATERFVDYEQGLSASRCSELGLVTTFIPSEPNQAGSAHSPQIARISAPLL